MEVVGNKQNLTWKIWAYSTMFFFTIFTLGPLLWMVITAFKPHKEIIENVFAFSKKLYFGNFSRAWNIGNLGLFTLNSIIYSSTATICTTILALMCGYGFAKFDYKVTKIFFFFFVTGLLLTVHSVLVPLFILETKIGIDDTRLGIILPYIAFGLPFCVYLATSYIKSIPDSMTEAGIIDGASYLQIFYQIIMPVAKPVVSTMFIFSFLTNWNEFVLVLVLSSRDKIRSLPVGINSFAGGMTRDFGLLFAALVIGTVPMIIFYALFHKQLAKGFAGGAIKG